MQKGEFPALAFVAALSIAFAGCCGLLEGQQVPEPLNVTVSEALNPEYGVYAVNGTGARISAIYTGDWFYPVQKGLLPGTSYGFMLLAKNGTVVVPLNENFTAYALGSGPAYESGVHQYHGFQPGKYTILLVVISGSRGTIVAKSNISTIPYTSASEKTLGLVGQNCSQFLPEDGLYASTDSPNASSLVACVRDLALANNDTEICAAAYNYFSNGLWIYDSCIGDFAVNSNDTSLCEKRYRSLDRSLCRADILGDWRECLNMECDDTCFLESKERKTELCIQGYAISHGNDTVCHQLTDDQLLDQCLGLTLSDVSYCNKLLDNVSRESCVQEASRYPHK